MPVYLCLRFECRRFGYTLSAEYYTLALAFQFPAAAPDNKHPPVLPVFSASRAVLHGQFSGRTASFIVQFFCDTARRAGGHNPIVRLHFFCRRFCRLFRKGSGKFAGSCAETVHHDLDESGERNKDPAGVREKMGTGNRQYRQCSPSDTGSAEIHTGSQKRGWSRWCLRYGE